MERLVIIDKENHDVFIEDVTDEMLAPYNGNEEEYIKDNYSTNDFAFEVNPSFQYVSEGDVMDISTDIDASIEEYRSFIDK